MHPPARFHSRHRILPAAILAVALALAAASTAPPPAAAGGTAEPGQEIFLAQKCNFCHGIESRGIAAKSPKAEGGDLSAVGDEHDAAWITKLLQKEVDNDQGEEHKKGFKGSDEDLETLANWLASLTAGE
jgi:mono/diheme cytochrome c family protein